MYDHRHHRSESTQVRVQKKRSTAGLWLAAGALLVALDMWAFLAADAIWTRVLLGLLTGAALVWVIVQPADD